MIPCTRGNVQAYVRRITSSHRKITCVVQHHIKDMLGDDRSLRASNWLLLLHCILSAVLLTRATSRVMGITCHVYCYSRRKNHEKMFHILIIIHIYSNLGFRNFFVFRCCNFAIIASFDIFVHFQYFCHKILKYMPKKIFV